MPAKRKGTRVVYGPGVRTTWPWGDAPRTLRGFPTPEQLRTTYAQIRAESKAARALMRTTKQTT